MPGSGQESAAPLGHRNLKFSARSQGREAVPTNAPVAADERRSE